MTLRDYFAGQTLAGLIGSERWNGGMPRALANTCYRMADAMLEARETHDDVSR